MIRLLADQKFNGHILDGLTGRDPGLDLIHVRDVGLAAAPDPTILEWAAAQGRVLLTHDRRIIPPFAHARVGQASRCQAFFSSVMIWQTGRAIDEILLAVYCLSPDECRDIVKYFPM